MASLLNGKVFFVRNRMPSSKICFEYYLTSFCQLSGQHDLSPIVVSCWSLKHNQVILIFIITIKVISISITYRSILEISNSATKNGDK